MEMTVILQKLEELKKYALLQCKEALTTDDAVLLTGLSKSYLYRLCQSGEIPYYKSKGGKCTYFNKSELTEWMLSTKFQSKEIVNHKARNKAFLGN